MDKIQQAVQEFNKENGNKNYPLKELVIYAIHRLDNMPCNEHSRTIGENKIRGKLILWILGVEITIITSVLIYIISCLQI